jgi:CubicO group peptidase (beta-lactamase class C family)
MKDPEGAGEIPGSPAMTTERGGTLQFLASKPRVSAACSLLRLIDGIRGRYYARLLKTMHSKLTHHLIATAAALAVLVACASVPPAPEAKMSDAALDSLAAEAMSATGARGLAIAIIDDGELVTAKAWGARNAAGDPLTPDTIMYGASLTKAVFGYLVLQLTDEGSLDLDQTIASMLPEPLPSYGSEADRRAYGGWGDLAGDERWRAVTPRHSLTHSIGFANFAFLEPDEKLKFHFDPGARYAYSGEGIMLLQFGLERGLGLNVGAELNKRLFAPLGMTNTSLIWRDDFAANLADGFAADGSVEPHDDRSRVRAAGSMDTTITDMGRMAAAMVSGYGLSKEARADFSAPQLAITSASQFPSLIPPPATAPFPGLAAGLGVITFEGPQGRGFYKGGHNDTTGNTMVCIEKGARCVVILANDVRAEAAFPAITKALLGETGLPWRWEYGDMEFVTLGE